VLEDAGLAVRVLEASDARRGPDPHWPLSGIDYLAQLRDGYRRELLRHMGVADPGDTLGLSVTGWPLVDALTGGALLTIPGG